MNLYWVTTEDHHEDWFIVASSSEDACKFHEDNEGYNPGDAKAEKVLSIPNATFAEPGWPPEELLIELGASFIQKDNIRVVEIEGRKFSEGMLESLINEICDDEFEARGDDRLNETKKPTEH
jgi:hypothetical protein